MGLKAYGALSLKFCQVCAMKSIQRPAYYVEFDAMCKIVFGSCLFSGTYSLENLVFYFRNKHFPINTIQYHVPSQMKKVHMKTTALKSSIDFAISSISHKLIRSDLIFRGRSVSHSLYLDLIKKHKRQSRPQLISGGRSWFHMGLVKVDSKTKVGYKKRDNVRILPNPDQILNCPFSSLHNYKALAQNEKQQDITH